MLCVLRRRGCNPNGTLGERRSRYRREHCSCPAVDQTRTVLQQVPIVPLPSSVSVQTAKLPLYTSQLDGFFLIPSKEGMRFGPCSMASHDYPPRIAKVIKKHTERHAGKCVCRTRTSQDSQCCAVRVYTTSPELFLDRVNTQ